MSKEEIKELLYNQIYERTKDFGRTQFVREIMRLERENKELKEQLNKYENPEDLTLMFMYCNEKSKDKIKELQQENQQLKEEKEKLIKHLENKIKISSMDDTYINGMHFISQNHAIYKNILDMLTKSKGNNNE